MAAAELNIIVGADVGEATKKLAELKGKLREMQSGIELTKEVINDFNQSIKRNEKEIAALTKELGKMSITSKAGVAAAKELKDKIAQLNTANSTLAQGVKTTTRELGLEQAAMKNMAAEVKTAEKASGGFAGGLSKVWGALRNIAYIVPGLGIAGLIGLLTGPLIAGFEKLIEKIYGTNKALIDLTEFNKNAGESYGKEAANLLILRNAIENVNLPMEKRLQAIKDLKKEFPGLFDGLTNEQLLTGNVANAYDLATKAIIRKARASAAAAELEKIAAQKFAILQKSEEEAAIANEKIRKAQARTDVITGGTGGVGGTGVNLSKQAVQREIADRFNAIKKGTDAEIAELNRKQAYMLKIAMEGADQTIVVEEEKIGKIKKINEKLIKEIKRRDYLPAFIHIKTSDEIDKEAEEAAKKIRDALGKVKMPSAIEISAGIGNSDRKNQFVLDQEAAAKEVAGFWEDTAKIINKGVVDSFSQLGESIGAVLAGGENSIGSFFAGIGKILSNSLKVLGKSVIEASTLIATIKKALNTAFAGNPALGIIAGIGLIALGSFIESKLPKFADGVTNFGGGMAIVGERGPELVRLPKGSDVIPNGRVNGMQSGGASVFIPAITLRGQDLVIAFNRASQTISRNG